MSRWPLWLLHAVGAALGWISYLASPTYRRRFQAIARQAGIELHEARPAIAEAGRLISELPYLWLRPDGDEMTEFLDRRRPPDSVLRCDRPPNAQ